MGKTKKISDELLQQFELERQVNIKNFKQIFADREKHGSDTKADWNNLMPTISAIEELVDAFFYFSKESVEITYSTEKLHFNYSVHFNGQIDGKAEGKFYATLNVVNTFISWAMKNL